MWRRTLFAVLALAPLAFGGVAVADDDDRRYDGDRGRGEHERHEHEEHEEHEHGNRGFVIPFFGPPASPRYTTPPGYGPYRNDEDYWRGRYDERNRVYGSPPYGSAPGYGPYNEAPPPPPGWGD